MQVLLNNIYLAPPKKILHYSHNSEDFIAVLTESTFSVYRSKSFNILYNCKLEEYSSFEYYNGTFILVKYNSLLVIKNWTIKEEYFIDDDLQLTHENKLNKNISINNILSYKETLILQINQILLFIDDYEVKYIYNTNDRIINIRIKQENLFILFNDYFLIYNILKKEESRHKLKENIQSSCLLDNFNNLFLTNIKDTVFILSDALVLFNYKNNFHWVFNIKEILHIYANSFLYISDKSFTYVFDLDTLEMIGQLEGRILNNHILFDKEIHLIKHKFYDTNIIIEDTLLFYANNELIYKSKLRSHKRIIAVQTNNIYFLYDKYFFINDHSLLSVNLSNINSIYQYKKTEEIFKMNGRFSVKEGKISLLHNHNSIYSFSNINNNIKLIDTNGNFDYTNLSYEYPFIAYGRNEIFVKNIYNPHTLVLNVKHDWLDNALINDIFINRKIIYALIRNKILTINLENKSEETIDLKHFEKDFSNLTVKENIILLRNSMHILLLERNKHTIIREYNLLNYKVELSECLNYLIVLGDKLTIINLKNNDIISKEISANDFVITNNKVILGCNDGIKKYTILNNEVIKKAKNDGYFYSIVNKEERNDFIDLWEDKEELLIEVIGLIN